MVATNKITNMHRGINHLAPQGNLNISTMCSSFDSNLLCITFNRSFVFLLTIMNEPGYYSNDYDE